MTTGGTTYTYAYNGLGDRVSQTVGEVTTTYTLDLNAGLTQVLSDGTNTYLYGYERIAQFSESETGYFLGDSLNSVRQMTDEDGVVTLTKQYEPYGEVLSSTGSGESMYGFDGEQTDTTGLVYMRARYYSSGQGRFISRDMWEGDSKVPMSYNLWVFGYANPIIYSDPSGLYPHGANQSDAGKWGVYETLYNITLQPGVGNNDWNANEFNAWAIISAVEMIGISFSKILDLDPITSFREVFGHVSFVLDDKLHGVDENGKDWQWYGWVINANLVHVLPQKFIPGFSSWIIDPGTYPLVRLMTHEMGHVFSTRVENSITAMETKLSTVLSIAISPEKLLENDGIYTAGQLITGTLINGIYNRNGNPSLDAYLGKSYADLRPTVCQDRYGNVVTTNLYHYNGYQWHPKGMLGGNSSTEDFADIFQNWVFSSLKDNLAGNGINDWMNKWMPTWIRLAINYGP